MKTQKISQETLTALRAGHAAGKTKTTLAHDFNLPLGTVVLALEPGCESVILQGAQGGPGKQAVLTPELQVGGVRFRVPLNLTRDQKDSLIDFFDNFDGSFDKELLFAPRKRAPRKSSQQVTQQEVNALARQIGEALVETPAQAEESTSPVDALEAEARMMAPSPDSPTQQTKAVADKPGRGRKRAVLA